MDERISGLTREKRALLFELIRVALAKGDGYRIESRAERSGPLALSFAQERLWFLDQLLPESAFYNVPAAVRIRGALDLKVLEASINEVIRRHESLRTSVVATDGKPAQVIAAVVKLELPVEAMQASGEEREEEVLRLAQEEAGRPFDLARGPLLRARVLSLGKDGHVLLFTMHHIMSDGWSLGVLVREIAAIYEAYSRGEQSPLPELPIQYGDYAVWQREWLQGAVLDKQMGYWKDKLQGSLPVLEVPSDHPRPAVQSNRGVTRSFSVGKELSMKLKSLSQRQGVTLFMTLLAAFKVLLYRYTGQEDVIVGSPIANRNRVELEGLIGFFVNTLVLRTDLSGDPSFEELLSRVREVALGAYAHQDLPFEKLVEELRPARDLSHHPLFQVMFVLQNAPMPALQLGTLKLEPIEVESGTTKFDLTLFITEVGQELRGAIEYSTDLFEAQTIERMIGHLRTLLEGIVADSGQRLSELPLLTEQERQQLLVEWNDTRKEYPNYNNLGELFEEQAARSPDAVAVVFEDQQLTYRELNQRANQLAHYLQKLGVGPEVRVGICVERSLEMVVGLLGILKAGGAYVPLDPGYPAERLRFMLADSEVPVLLTQEALADALPDRGATVVCLDTGWKLISQQPVTNPVCCALPDNLAYIIYTSGSTGTPKGVALSNKNLINLLLWQRDVTPRRAPMVLQFASISFDASFHEMFSAWTCAGSIVLITNDVQRDIGDLLSHIRQKAIDCVFLPSIVVQLLSAMAAKNSTPLESICEVFSNAEQLRVTDQIRRAFLLSGKCRLCNIYGPSETHVVTSFELSKNVVDWPILPPIGRPISNSEIYILDGYQNPVPIGIGGELYIGGAGLGRGYLKRPGLTAEKFVPDRFSKEPGARLYRTGDLARYLPDGNIEFLGRIDHQVKIRGYRIELGEIEAVLGQHPGVKEAVVLAREDQPGEKRLVAYVVAQPDALVSRNELRNYLKEKLPEYMVPAWYVTLEFLPLSPNGKVDRRALPPPESDRPDLQETYVAPRTPIEEMLAALWAELLGLERVGIHDNFFDLGGHSLLATQLMSRVQDILEVEIPLRALFEHATVAELTEAIQQTKAAGNTAVALPIPRAERSGPLALSFAQERLWFLDQLLPESAFYNVPAAVRIRGALDLKVLEASINEVIRRHESLRTSVVATDGKPAQVIAAVVKLELPVEAMQASGEEREEEVLRLAQEEAGRPFDLARGPLLRARVLSLGKDGHVLLFTMHHIMSDGWSLGVLVREIAAIYEAYSRGEQSPLPELPIQYGDYAVWQREWLQGAVLDKQMGYWKDKLQGSLPVLEVPSDHPRPAVQSNRGVTRSFSVGKELSMKLKSLSQRQGVTLFMTLLAAFKVLLYRYTGQEDVIVGSPIANRNRVELEGLIGFFVNTLVLRTDLSGDPSFEELLSRVREVALGAYAHQDLPFEKLVEELRPARDLSHHPLFQVMFVLQNAPMPALQLGTLKLEPIEVESGTTKFDLTLFITEVGQELRGAIEYSTDLFEAQTIERMIGHLRTLLEGIVADSGQRLSELPLLTEQERQQLLVEWNDTRKEYPNYNNLGELFEEQAARSPDAVAVVFEDQQLTYRELNQRANQLAHYLQKLGVGPEVRVGICVERSLEMVVGLLGILKAGGAYVPLDPGYPAERLRFMLADSEVPVLLTQEALADALPDRGATVVCLDTGWKLISQQPVTNPVCCALPDNLAYIIYTSGSTGTPKGVMNTHANVVRLFHTTQLLYNFDGNDVWTLFHSYSFDFSVWEFWGAFLYGGRLVVVPHSTTQSLDTFTKLLRDKRITILNQTPSAFRQLIRILKPDAAKELNLRLLIFGGEALNINIVHDWLERFGDERPQLNNMYGITETTIHVTHHRLFANPTVQWDNSVGRPLDDLNAFILDGYQNPVPIGIGGELYIGGAGLGRGYLKRPGLTAEKFVPDRFSKEPGARLYRTGDLARYLPDGNIEFLGRIDHQVKIRGYRIELGEIEAVLGQHPGVKEAVVLAREDQPGEKRLVAYVVAQPDALVSRNELRNYLKEKLPEYMVPAWYVTLEFLPLSPNGKVDRRALPPPESDRPDLQETYVAPRTPIEEMLAALWAELLGLERVGIHDNFFDLGGHSLLATQLMSRVQDILEVEIPLRALFEHATVAELTEAIQVAVGGPAELANLLDIVTEIANLSEKRTLELITSLESNPRLSIP